MTEEAKNDIKLHGRTSNYYVSGPHATWDVNPLRSKEQFALDYRKDPVAAAAKYECNPAGSSDPYFRDMTIFDNSMDRKEPAITVSYELQERESEETKNVVKQWEPVFEIAEWFKPVPGALYAMHGDLAVVGDRAGVAMSHVVSWVEKEVTFLNEANILESRVERLPIVRNDFTIAFSADIGSNPPREIKIRWARELAFQLIKLGFDVAYFSFDGFQSRDSMQILEDAGIETERVSTDINNNIWRTLKDVASDHRLKMEHNQDLRTELEALVDLGRKVDHPPAGGKDMADAFGCSIAGAIQLGGEESDGYEEVQAGKSIFNIGINMPGLLQNEEYSVSLHNTLPIGMSMEAPIGSN
jgi:hypothetical protein